MSATAPTARPAASRHPSTTSCVRRTVSLARTALCFIALTLGSVLLLVLFVLTLGRAPRTIAWGTRALARTILSIVGIRLDVRGRSRIPSGQAVFISNHPSTLDIVTLVALQLPNVRFFLARWLRWVLPVGIIATLIGVFWTVPQSMTEARRRLFAKASATLARTGQNVYLSPEGRRVVGPTVGAFNRGAFHLALSLQAPIVPIHLDIPTESNPGMGFDVQPGTVVVRFGHPIDTRTWRLDTLEQHRDDVRSLYLVDPAESFA